MRTNLKINQKVDKAKMFSPKSSAYIFCCRKSNIGCRVIFVVSVVVEIVYVSVRFGVIVRYAVPNFNFHLLNTI
jgi:hypothetical protein